MLLRWAGESPSQTEVEGNESGLANTPIVLFCASRRRSWEGNRRDVPCAGRDAGNRKEGASLGGILTRLVALSSTMNSALFFNKSFLFLLSIQFHPSLLVLSQLVECRLKLRDCVHQSYVQRLQKGRYKSHLRLFKIYKSSIASRRNRESQETLLVALLEELSCYSLGPLLSQREGSTLVWNVSCVEDILERNRFVFLGTLPSIQQSLEDVDVLKVLVVISGQN